MKLKICKIGNSLGASFPKEVLDKLQVGEGDTIYVTETPDGVQLTTYDPEFEQIMKAASQVTRRYRNALRELAK
ncbi:MULTISPECIES: AbrB/MazE/SpoVT family DNA-binding domain-containing protein [Microcystis]|jgi:putative addiction module antidote|uniref:AbrB/MazE/SpoVT family DNA-binding domain-containing protein n=2 Tax=Microcystis TaxID=1125 RepID=A0A841USL9_MICAE|nr:MULTISPECIES: AbrB/MazE/SpoVT family DNA-binding domain-containing protein [Microcystis]AKV67701.1 Prevent host death protein Phd antitoxin [Microcystis panniformis FACHB-1757]MBC1191924.1 AbrB/MazE/SpoVT family DNA-binding domain-containing protein [Microcystis aeruginosa BLCC-F108]MBE9071646.1 AbrB/MazE/SpoVT family DNA-binding domain-containing protein [Microcystis sp. LEGE 08355]MCA2592636.1 AbrB/MazE/SpoVT family DNA-binding domain-containing protein [Microcystis sp. M31BS1]MDB9410835.